LARPTSLIKEEIQVIGPRKLGLDAWFSYIFFKKKEWKICPSFINRKDDMLSTPLEETTCHLLGYLSIYYNIFRVKVSDAAGMFLNLWKKNIFFNQNLSFVILLF
jgi:hypothetical protein